jgi:uncharacterized membrane protein
MRAAPLALALALAACQQPEAPPAPEASPPPSAPAVDPAPAAPAASRLGDIEGRGTEPFWFVRVAGDAITLERPDHPTLTATGAAAGVEGERTVWQAQTVRVAAWSQPGCSDGMSELAYPLAVEVVVGGETLKGCGARAGELPRGER